MLLAKCLQKVSKQTFVGIGKSSSTRSIYTKDKYLDKSNYVPSEQDYVEQYLKNYMKDDPRPLTDEDKAKLCEQARVIAGEQLNSEDQQDNILELQEQKENNENNSHKVEEEGKDKSKLIEPETVKQVFQKWLEVDKDPASQEAQEYYRRFEETERKNTHKKPINIIIKTFKRNRTNEHEPLDNESLGQRQDLEAEEFERKYIDYKAVQFPEINPVDLKVKHGQQQYKLANYRYPSLTEQRKGIIYFIHGYGDYCQRYAYFAEGFAQQGYDFVGIDQAGFGLSEGPRGVLHSEEMMMDQHLTHFDQVRSKFGGSDVPEFILGYSLGGLLSLKLSIISQHKFNGLGLLSPYIKIKNQQFFQKFSPMAKFAAKVIPNLRSEVPTQAKTRIKRHISESMNDPLLEFKKISAQSLALNDQIMKKFHESEIQLIKTPLIMILGGQEQVVSNKAAQEFFDKVPVTDKDIITYDDLDHFIIHDKEYLPMITKDLSGWFNTHI